MRFLREMIVRRGHGGTPTQAADEPPVKDFFELSPMRERLARSRAADLEADRDDDPEVDVARMVADRLGADRVGEATVQSSARPRRPTAAQPGEGFDDLEFGAFDDDEIDSFDLDTAASDAPAAVATKPASGHDPQLARRPMTVPRNERLAQVRAAGAADDEEPDALEDLTDDPALAALMASRKPVEPADPASSGDLVPAPTAMREAAAAWQAETGLATSPAVDTRSDDAILAGIAAALPAAARAVLGAVAVDKTVAAPAPQPDQPAAPPLPEPTTAPWVAAAPVPDPSPAIVTSPRAPRIWDIEAEAQEAAVMRFAESAVPPPPTVPAKPAEALASARDPLPPEPLRTEPPRKSGRVRTRLLGFHAAEDAAPDPLAAPSAAPVAGPVRHPVGWVVVTDGPGRGAAFTLRAGVSPIGRDEDQTIQLDFGDTAISRQMHAAIAYDQESRGFFLGHGGKSNIVRLNGRPVLSTEDLSDGDVIRIGETTLKFVAFCGRDFDWSVDPADPQTGGRTDARL